MASKDLNRVSSNVQKMLAAKAPDADLEAYLKSEGYTVNSFAGAMQRQKETGGIERPGNALRTAAQGLLFNFADEAEAGIRALASEGLGGFRSQNTLSGLVTGNQPKSRYERELAAIRGGLEDYRSDSPVTAALTELGGAVAPAVGGLLLAPFTGGTSTAATANVARTAPTLLNQIKTGAKIGAVTGAVSGAGASEGGVANRLQGALQGGGIGAVTGGAIPVAMASGRTVIEKGKDIIGRSGDDAARKADELVMKSMSRDEKTPFGIQRQINENTRIGAKPETLADLGGANLRGRAAAAANVPGPTKERAKNFLTERVRGQSERLADDLQLTMGEKLENTNKLAAQIVEERSKQAAPLYRAAYEKGGVVDDNKISDFLKLPKFKEAFARAERIAELEGEKLPQIYKPLRDAQGNVIRDADGLVLYGDLESLPNLKVLDYVKRGLDDAIGTGTAKGSLGRTEIGALKKARREFVTRLDDIGPDEYKEARKVFAGHTEAKEALESGRNVFMMPENDWREVAEEFAKMTPLEKQMFRRGVVDAARIRMNQSSNEVGTARDVTRVFGSKETMNRLRDVYPDDESFNLFKTNLQRESQMAGTRNDVITGSRTTPLAQDIEDTNALMPSAVETRALLGGNLFPAIFGAGQRFVEGRMQGVTGDVAEQLGNKLMGLQGPALSQYMDDLIVRRMQIDNELASRAARRGLMSVPAGNLSGGLLGVTE